MVELEKIEWDDLAAAHLKEAVGTGYGLPEMEIEVSTGSAELYGAFYDGKRFASCILRKDFDELVVVAAGGETREQSTFALMLPLVKQIAQEKGLSRLRAHSFDPAKVRLMELAGWVQDEYILRAGV